MIGLLVQLLILALIFGVAWWIISLIPLPDPFPMILRVCFAVILLITLIQLVGGGLGWPLFPR